MTESGDRARKALREFADAVEQMVRESGGETSPAMVTMFVTQMDSVIGLLELKPSQPRLE